MQVTQASYLLKIIQIRLCCTHPHSRNYHHLTPHHPGRLDICVRLTEHCNKPLFGVTAQTILLHSESYPPASLVPIMFVFLIITE